MSTEVIISIDAQPEQRAEAPHAPAAAEHVAGSAAIAGAQQPEAPVMPTATWNDLVAPVSNFY